MIYKINNIPLRNYGIHNGRAINSNIALAGFLNMPERIGKTHHDWSDELGTEPYVLASEIKHGGRDLQYTGYIKGDSKEDCIQRLNEFYTDINQLTDLFEFATPWGTYNVYIKEAITGKYLQSGWAELHITFRQPVVPITATPPTGNSIAQYHINNVPYTSLGAFVASVQDNFNRPQTKEANYTAYGVEGYQVTKQAPLEITQELYFSATDFTTLKNNVEQLHALLASPGTKIMNVDTMERECFNTAGFTVDSIRVMPGLCICRVVLPLLMVGAAIPVEPEYLLDSKGNAVIDFTQFIQDPTALDFLLDSDGNKIIDNNYTNVIQ
ncbi:hypothetical protein [Cellulophaga lytica]|uniref:hypothetical protein n=1 Tax=Cellulophaga lytica TaxID=979 RepID=UPI003CE57141